MKFLHIADLHIGKNVNGFSMLGEQERAFAQVADYIRAEKPAALVIAGDVYDRAVPGIEAVRLFDDFLTALAKENVAVLLISGNHDSPDRLNYASRLLQDRKLFLCGVFDGTLKKVVLNDEYGEVNFWLLPFIKPSALRGLLPVQDETYEEAFRTALETGGVDYTARNVLVAHQFFTGPGLKPLRSDSELDSVGGLDAIGAALLERFDYAALGHLHGAQSLGAARLRYAGSPLKYSFSEWRQEKSVTLVELKEKGSFSITSLPLSPLHDMREIKGKFEKLTSDEVSSLADREDYLRVILTDEEEIIDPMGKLRRVYPNVMSLDFENARTRELDEPVLSSDASPSSPFELFSEFFLDMQKSTMSAEQAEIVRELLEAGDGT